MAKKDFGSINTERNSNVIKAMEQAVTKKGQQGSADPAEAAERKAAMRTQGRKGCKSDRINMAFSAENYEYLRLMAKATGKTITQFCNFVIAKHREEHAEQLQAAKELIKALE